jgi:molybdate transport system regulatory protein
MPVYKLKKVTRHPDIPVKGYLVRCRMWVEKDGEIYISRGRITLLERIDELGSITAAARSMKLNYRNAWLWVEAMNRLAESPLVEKGTGGRGGGYAKLTEKGKEVVIKYRKLDNEIEEHIGEHILS